MSTGLALLGVELHTDRVGLFVDIAGVHGMGLEHNTFVIDSVFYYN